MCDGNKLELRKGHSPSYSSHHFLVITTTTDMFRSAVSKSLFGAARPTLSKVIARPSVARGYHEKVISHYEKPRNVCLVFFRVWTAFLSDNDFFLRSRLVLSPKVTLTSEQDSLGHLREFSSDRPARRQPRS